MRSIIVAVAVVTFSLFGNVHAEENFNIKAKLKKVVKFDNKLALEKNQTEFVKVSFKIDEEGKIKVLEMNYSNEGIKQQLIDKLSEMKVDEQHDINEVYHFNFTFTKF